MVASTKTGTNSMAPKTQRSWSDVQTAIATASIVTTLGLWNLFATPVQKPKAQTDQPPADAALTPMPQVKIVFATKVAPQPQTKKKNKNNNNGGGGGGGGGGNNTVSAPANNTNNNTVTSTKTS